MSEASLRRAAPLLLACSVLVFAASGKLPFGAWHRVSDNPILSPQGDGWESAGTFNPAVVMHDGKYVMLYRAQDRQGTSRLGYAESADGVHFTRRPEPVLEPETEYEKDGGVEDPRLVKIGDYLLSDLYRLQQERCAAMSGYFAGPGALGPQGRDSSCQ